MSRRISAAAQQGFTIIEVLAASVVLVIGVLGAFGLAQRAMSSSYTTRAREGATNLARELLEAARSVPYRDLTPTEIVPQLEAQPGLADANLGDGSYTIRRRGVTYSITATVCSIDDPADGTGPHGSGTYCADSAGGSSSGTILDFSAGAGVNGSTVDGSLSLGGGTPDDYKRALVTVAWQRQGAHSITAQSLIDDPGNSDGPAITVYAASTATVTDPLAAGVAFNLTTSVPPATVNWSVDGVVAGTPTGSGTSWSFSWPLSGLLDGSYIVAAQAFDANGLSGSPRALTITLNRYLPQAPTGLNAGLNNQVVDLEWLPNPERDIAGYRVYRLNGAGLKLVCPGSGSTPITATNCQDTSPPGGLAPSYLVVAVDKSSVSPYPFREGAPSAIVQVPLLNNPPNAPTGLTATTGSGTTTLSWKAPAVADPDLGDSIAFYRIYRDGATYADRYDRTGTGTTYTYTDTHTGGDQHQYRITAVDTHLAESTIVGPVTG